MTFAQLAAKRRSIRKFEDRKVEREKIEKILEMTLTAPSSKNVRSTRIAVVEDKAVLKKISTMRESGSDFVKDAPLAFVIMGDDSLTDLWRENAAISATILQLAAESLGLGSCWVHVFGRRHSENDPEGLLAGDYLRREVPQLNFCRILCVVAVGYSAIEHRPQELVIDPTKVIFI